MQLRIEKNKFVWNQKKTNSKFIFFHVPAYGVNGIFYF